MTRGRVPLLERLGRVPSGRRSRRARRRSRRATAAFILLFIFTIPVSTVGAFTAAASTHQCTAAKSTTVAPGRGRACRPCTDAGAGRRPSGHRPR